MVPLRQAGNSKCRRRTGLASLGLYRASAYYMCMHMCMHLREQVLDHLAVGGEAMLIVDEELEGFFVDSEDDEPTSRRLSLAGSRTDVWDDEDDGLSQCPTSEVRSLPAFTASHSRPRPEAVDLGNRSGVRRATKPPPERSR